MKNKFKFAVRRGLVLTACVSSLAGVNGFSLTLAVPTNTPTVAVRPLAPATRMTAPPVPNAARATTPNVTTDDIRDIRGPKHMASPWLWPLWLAVGAALAALLYLARLWNRRRALTVARLPYEIALARLEEARRLMQPENAREFSIVVSEIVRHYIEERFQVWAARRTTEEFLHDLLEPSEAPLTSHRELLADFLRHCDLAKFALWILSLDEMATMHASARAFVLETGRPPTPETSSATAPPVPERTVATPQPVHANV